MNSIYRLRSLPRAIVLAVGALATSAMILAGAPQIAPTAYGQEHSVAIVEPSEDIMSWVYEPSVIEVTAGETVTWVNSGTVPHNVLEPNGAFSVPIMNAGDVFSWTTTEPGTFEYICLFHPWMKGTVIVN